MIKLLTIILAPSAFLYYIFRDLPVLLKHPDLLRGIKEIIYISIIGILSSFLIQQWKENKYYQQEKIKLMKRIGNKTYDWILK